MIKIILIGKIKNRELSELSKEYESRVRYFDKLEIIELKDSSIEKEGEGIIQALGKSRGRVYILSEEGKGYTSQKFSEELEKDLMRGGSTFVVGGAYGLSEEVKKMGELISLSYMTFTHEFARVILFEQLYRAKSISAGKKYHH